MARHTLKICEPKGISYTVRREKHSFDTAMAEDEKARLDARCPHFSLGGGFFHVGMVAMLALLLASPLEKRNLTVLPISFAFLAAYHVFMLDVATRCPFPVMGRAFTPVELSCLEAMAPLSRQILSYINVFDLTVGWQLAPLLIWGALAWRRWA